MLEQDYFANALAKFTHEVASGGSIRHLADLGYTVKQITERLPFPTPYEKVRKDVWEHLLDTRVVLLEEPGAEGKKAREKSNYVLEYNQYGKASFRLVTAQEEMQKPVVGEERRFEADGMKKQQRVRAKMVPGSFFSGKARRLPFIWEKNVLKTEKSCPIVPVFSTCKDGKIPPAFKQRWRCLKKGRENM